MFIYFHNRLISRVLLYWNTIVGATSWIAVTIVWHCARIETRRGRYRYWYRCSSRPGLEVSVYFYSRQKVARVRRVFRIGHCLRYMCLLIVGACVTESNVSHLILWHFEQEKRWGCHCDIPKKVWQDKELRASVLKTASAFSWMYLYC